MAYYSQNYAGILGSALIASFGEDVKWSVTGDLVQITSRPSLATTIVVNTKKERKKILGYM